ncbi:pancreatic lipase-related protein 2-like [Rhynchocyon petersi]
MLSSWILSILLLNTVTGMELCFKNLGCFSDQKPWGGTLQRPLKLLPWMPKLINTRFLLYTNENPDKYQLIDATNPDTIKASNFRPDRKTRFIIHGFIDKGENKWLSDMCKNMFTVEEVNCICVDWRGGSRTTYSQAVQNVRVVGAQIAFLINVMRCSDPPQKELELCHENVHLIGHSLGAHVAGEAGKRLNGRVGRTTGLDPAEPYFQDTPKEVRLDPSDAMFVDVIHTDIAPTIPFLGWGMSQKVGHLDFFPNGGRHMPGCHGKKNQSIVDKLGDINNLWIGSSTEVPPESSVMFASLDLDKVVACNHLKSYEYYNSSILNPDGFLGYPCASYIKFQKGKCFPCPKDGCPQMGHYADQFKGKTNDVGQTFYLNTGSDNYPLWRYRVSVTLAGEKDVSGSIWIALHGSNEISKKYKISKGNLRPATSHMLDIDMDSNVGEIEKVNFLWKTLNMNPKDKLGASRITVQRGDDGTEYTFCSSDTVQSNVLQPLYPC